MLRGLRAVAAEKNLCPRVTSAGTEVAHRSRSKRRKKTSPLAPLLDWPRVAFNPEGRPGGPSQPGDARFVLSRSRTNVLCVLLRWLARWVQAIATWVGGRNRRLPGRGVCAKNRALSTGGNALRGHLGFYLRPHRQQRGGRRGAQTNPLGPPAQNTDFVAFPRPRVVTEGRGWVGGRCSDTFVDPSRPGVVAAADRRTRAKAGTQKPLGPPVLPRAGALGNDLGSAWKAGPGWPLGTVSYSPRRRPSLDRAPAPAMTGGKNWGGVSNGRGDAVKSGEAVTVVGRSSRRGPRRGFLRALRNLYANLSLPTTEPNCEEWFSRPRQSFLRCFFQAAGARGNIRSRQGTRRPVGSSPDGGGGRLVVCGFSAPAIGLGIRVFNLASMDLSVAS